jgi:hypothetical protein
VFGRVVGFESCVVVFGGLVVWIVFGGARGGGRRLVLETTLACVTVMCTQASKQGKELRWLACWLAPAQIELIERIQLCAPFASAS